MKLPNIPPKKSEEVFAGILKGFEKIDLQEFEKPMFACPLGITERIVKARSAC